MPNDFYHFTCRHAVASLDMVPHTNRALVSPLCTHDEQFCGGMLSALPCGDVNQTYCLAVMLIKHDCVYLLMFAVVSSNMSSRQYTWVKQCSSMAVPYNQPGQPVQCLMYQLIQLQ